MAYRRHPNEDIYKRDIERVTTITGASQMTGRHPNTIYQHIIIGNIYAELINQVWIVSIASVRDYYKIQENEQ